MQRYAMDYRDRYGEPFQRERGWGGALRPSGRSGYDERSYQGTGYTNPAEASPYGRSRRYLPGPPGRPAALPPRRTYAEDFGIAPERGRRYGGGESRFQAWDYLAVDLVRAAEIMTPNPEAVTPDTPLIEVARRMRDLDVGVMPVIDDPDSSRLQGVVTDRDIAIRAAAEGKDLKKTRVREIMSPHPATVGENDHMREVFTVMKRSRVRRVPVVGADGTLVGIIAQADLAVKYAGLDLQRETEVEEVIERISEPARPRWRGGAVSTDSRDRGLRRFRPDFDVEIPDRVRSGWRTLRAEARELMGRNYDRGWR